MEKGNNLYDTIKCEYIIFFFYPPRIFCFFQQTRTMASKHFSCSLQKNGASQKLHPIYMRAITKVVNHNSILFFPKFLIGNGRLSKRIANLSPSQLKKKKKKNYHAPVIVLGIQQLCNRLATQQVCIYEQPPTFKRNYLSLCLFLNTLKIGVISTYP